MQRSSVRDGRVRLGRKRYKRSEAPSRDNLSRDISFQPRHLQRPLRLSRSKLGQPPSFCSKVSRSLRSCLKRVSALGAVQWRYTRTNSKHCSKNRSYTLSIFTDFSTTSLCGLSCPLRGTPVILFTTSCPSTTSPKMV